MVAANAVDRLPPGPVLLRAPNWIGDAVLATPALAALAAALPDRAITVASREPALSVFAGHPAVHDTVEVPPAGPAAEFVGRIASRRYAVAVLLAPSFRSAWQAFRARVPHRWGYASDLRRPLLTFCPGARGRRPEVHQARDYVSLLEAAGIAAPRVLRPDVHPDEADEAAAMAVADIVSDGGARPVVALHPGAAFGPTKRWPAERFVDVGVAAARAGAGVAVLGGPGERPLCAAVARAVAAGARDPGAAWAFAGTESLPLRAVASLARRAQVLVTNDTGPMHLWAAGGGRVIAVFGMSLPGLHGPLGGESRVFHREELRCAGCYRPKCRYALECLHGIGSDEVARAVLETLRVPPPPGPIEQSLDADLEPTDWTLPPVRARGGGGP